MHRLNAQPLGRCRHAELLAEQAVERERTGAIGLHAHVSRADRRTGNPRSTAPAQSEPAVQRERRWHDRHGQGNPDGHGRPPFPRRFQKQAERDGAGRGGEWLRPFDHHCLHEGAIGAHQDIERDELGAQRGQRRSRPGHLNRPK